MSKPKSSKIYYITPFLFSLFPIYNTPALDYQSNTNIQFTFNPTLSVSVSGDLMIDNLSPGTAKDSNIIDVNVATNNVTGYTLSATVGNSTTNPSNELRHSGYDGSNNSNNNYKFTSTSTDITELTNLEPNTWGYNYSTDNGTNWHDYSTLPLYTNTGAALSEKYNASNDNIKFKIGAKASSTQAAGTYTNTINFTATANPEVRYYMQEFTNSVCQELASDNDYTVYDMRDGNVYTIRYISNRCWMTSDLKFTGVSLSPTTSNVLNDTTIIWHDLDGLEGSDVNGYCYGKYIDGFGNGYDYACKHESLDGDGSLSVYYNYAGATAMTILGSNNESQNIYNICPSNWTLPSYNQASWLVDALSSSINIFNPATNGIYRNGQLLQNDTNGFWWLNTSKKAVNNVLYRDRLFYDVDRDLLSESSSIGLTTFPYVGASIRCIIKQ